MLKQLIFVIICNFFVKTTSAQSVWSCNNGFFYREDDCRFCVCIFGFSSCTGFGCGAQQYYVQRICVIGSKWAIDCNNCTCTVDNGAVCTVKQCHHRPTTERSTFKFPITYPKLPSTSPSTLLSDEDPPSPPTKIVTPSSSSSPTTTPCTDPPCLPSKSNDYDF